MRQFNSATKKFTTKTLKKIIDSSIKNLGELEYDKLQCQRNIISAEKIEVRITHKSTVPKLIHKKTFSAKKLLKTIDSSIKNLGKLEFDTQNYLEQQKIKVSLKN